MAVNLHLFGEEWEIPADTEKITCKLNDIIIKHPNKRGKKRKKNQRMQEYVDIDKVQRINVAYLTASLG